MQNVESTGLISTTWVLGWYLYTLWMGLCGIYYQIWLSFFANIQGDHTWETIYKNGVTTCNSYIQPYI